MPYAKVPDVPEVVDHAHGIPGSIARIQMVQPAAREAATTEAVFDFGGQHLLTVLNTAHGSGFQFETVVVSTARACLFVLSKRPAETAVHPAGSDERCGNRICLCRLF
jgi:hypothetical protein